MARITVEHFGFEGTGRTVKEAKEDAARKVKAALDGNYTPRSVTYKGNVGIVYREPSYGWHDKVFWADANQTAKVDRVYGSSGGTEDPDERLQNVIYHILQVVENPADIITEPDVPTILADAKLRRELVGYMRWQRAARYARDVLGMSDEVHRWACDNERHFKHGSQPQAETVAA